MNAVMLQANFEQEIEDLIATSQKLLQDADRFTDRKSLAKELLSRLRPDRTPQAINKTPSGEIHNDDGHDLVVLRILGRLARLEPLNLCITVGVCGLAQDLYEFLDISSGEPALIHKHHIWVRPILFGLADDVHSAWKVGL